VKSFKNNREIAKYAAEQLGYNEATHITDSTFGVVYSVSDDKVLKVTEEVSDARTCNILRRKPWTKHLINIYDVRHEEIAVREELSTHINDYYFILMDKVVFQQFNLLPASTSLEGLKDNINHMLKNYNNDNSDFAPGVENRFLILQIIEIYKELKKHKIVGFDFHGRNLGWKVDEDGEMNLVFFDIDNFKNDFKRTTDEKLPLTPEEKKEKNKGILSVTDLALKEDKYFNDFDCAPGPPLVNKPAGDSSSILAAGASDGRIGGEFYGNVDPTSVPTALRYKYRILKPIKKRDKKRQRVIDRIKKLNVRKYAEWSQDI
jgi:hypothetical protein